MSSSARLKYMVQSALLNNDLNSARDAYNQWQIANCYYPQTVQTYDAHTQNWRIMQVPCGRCYHCYESKINEWCTRMYAHAEDFKNVYFVTLTYASFYKSDSPTIKLIMSKLQDAIWHLDAKNSTHRLCFSPCLLCKKHYQNFFKRLRKNTGLSDITYVLSGEYGHDYGRPHFHMILFTNGTISKDDIRRAWSVCLWRKDNGSFEFRRNQKYGGRGYDFPIGRVDFNDLVANGTFNTYAKVRVDGTYMSAVNCFSYVCKYVCKRDNANLSRVNIAYNALFHKKTFCKAWSKDAEIPIIIDYLNKLGYPHSNISNIIKQYSYEKIIFQPQGIYATSSLPTFSYSILFGQRIKNYTYPKYIADFRKKFSPFCEFSRGTPIGSLYAIRHLPEFAQGVFNKPTLQTAGFVVPSYFRRKAQNSLYGLRQPKRTLKGFSLAMGGLVHLFGRLDSSLKTGIPLREFTFSKVNHYSSEQALRSYLCHFRDVSTGERIIFTDATAACYRYNRHTRKYQLTREMPVADWLRKWCSALQAEFVRHEQQVAISEKNAFYRDDALDLLQESVAPLDTLRDSFIENSKRVRDSHQQLYFDIHNNIE